MARDRNLFAWQAYVIVTSILSVLLLGCVFYLWKIHTDLVKTSAAKVDEMSKLNSEKLLSDKRVARLKAMLGYNQTEDNYLSEELKTDPEMQEVEKNFPLDMDVFATSAKNKNYREFPVTLINTIRERNKQVQDLKNLIEQQKAANETLGKSQAEARKLNDQAKQKAEDDLAQARRDHAAQIEKLNGEKAKIQQLVDKFKADLEAANNKLAAQLKTLRDENTKQKSTIDLQTVKLAEYQENNFDEPAGTVTNVADASRKVWVNIGSDDGLREGVAFVVFDESTRDVADAKVKAEMIVEKVLDRHLAMCTVTSGITKSPVIPGDIVYSPAWRKGRTSTFALVGLMDITNDGRDDRELIKSRIRSSGGKVVFEALPDGKTAVAPQTNGMDSNTVFVVLGSDVVLAGDNPTKDQLDRSERYKKYINEAKILGIPQITANKLMGYLKGVSDTRTVPLGSQLRGDDFEPRPENGVIRESNGEVSELFRSRRPKE